MVRTSPETCIACTQTNEYAAGTSSAKRDVDKYKRTDTISQWPYIILLLVMLTLSGGASASRKLHPIAEFPNHHLAGGSLQAKIRNEALCKMECVHTSWCAALDFDYNKLTCWFHGAANVCKKLRGLRRANHYRYVECYENSHRPEGVLADGITDVDACVSYCAQITACHAVDFGGSLCWLHSEASACKTSLPKLGCSHYTLKSCRSASRSLAVSPAGLNHNGATLAALQNVEKQYRDAHSVGGAHMTGISTWVDCILACVGNCHSVDFDTTDNSCWHHRGVRGCQPPDAHRTGSYHYQMAGCNVPVNDQPKGVVSHVRRLHSPVIVSAPASVMVAPPVAPPKLVIPPPVLRALGVTTCGRPAIPPSGSRIIGGDESRAHSWPWQVALRNINARSSRCAGTLIAPQWVLTTAHCVDQDQTPANWFVLAGAHDLLQLEGSRAVHAVSRIIIHERFDLNTFNNDLALLRLTVPVQFNTHISPICLPPLNTVLAAGTQCIIAGWGVAANGRRPLNQATVPVVSLPTCRRPEWLGLEFTLTDNMMCAGYENGGVDTCQGDSGGPLVCFVNNHWIQAGVTSFGRGCGMPRKPGVYTLVSRYVTWIQNIVNTF